MNSTLPDQDLTRLINELVGYISRTRNHKILVAIYMFIETSQYHQLAL